MGALKLAYVGLLLTVLTVGLSSSLGLSVSQVNLSNGQNASGYLSRS